MRIALICIDYPPLRSSCAIQMRDLAKEFVRQGHEPVVFVPAENARRAWQSEVSDGIQVIRLASFSTRNVGYIRRTLAEMLLSFTMYYGLRKSRFPVAELDAAVWYSPSIFFGPLIRALKFSSGCKSYLILRDMFPEWTLDLGLMKKGPVYYWFKLVARYQYAVADVIGVQTQSNLKYLEQWARSCNKPIEVLNNWLSVAQQQGSTITVDQTPIAGRKIFVYIGNMGVAQGMDILVELAQKLMYRKDIGFLFVGRGSEVERLKAYAADNNLDNIIFHNEVDSSEMPGLLAMCHVGLIALDPRHKSHNIPGKFLTYMQAGLPVLARINPGTDLVKLIENEGVGRVYSGDKSEEFQQIAEDFIDNNQDWEAMVKQGRLLSQRMFSSGAAVKQIVSALSGNSGH